jgi:hypothetical protein
MIATQNHSQVKMLFLLDFLCDNLMHPCNTPTYDRGSFFGSAFIVAGYGDSTAGLGSDPYLIQKLTARVERRPGRR